jgi:hypothetical protein
MISLNHLAERSMSTDMLDTYRHVGEEIHRYGVMVAIRDAETDCYIYNNMSQTWTGFSLNEWNAMSPRERLWHFHPTDLEEFKPIYWKWRDSACMENLKLNYRLRSKSGTLLEVECHFIQVTVQGKMFIVEVSICTPPSFKPKIGVEEDEMQYIGTS